MIRVNVSLTDTTGTVTIDRGQVAAALRPWYPDAPPEISEAINRLQASLDQAPTDQLGTEDANLSTTKLCAFLGVNVEWG